MNSLLLVALFAVSAISDGSNWPQFRGPHGNGHADSQSVPTHWSETENVAWKTPIHGRGWSSPIVWGGKIWLSTATEDGSEMFAIGLNAKNGKILHDIKLFDVLKPREIHKLNSYASPTPAVEEGRVFFHFGSYGTACLNSENGKVLWSRRDLPCNHFRGPGSSPILYGNLLIMHFDGFDYQYVVALDKLTGETVWKVDRSNDYQTDNGDLKKAFSTPLVIDFDGKEQLISSGSKALFSYDPMTGKENWQVNYKGFSGAARPLFGHGLVFVSTGFSKAEMLAVRPVGTGNVTESNIAWKASRAIPSKPSPILVEDLIYMVDDQGVASCLEAVTGDRVWTKRLGGNFSASPVYAGGLIYFCNHEGETFVIKPSRVFTKVAVNLLEDGFMASPAVSDNALILRTRSCLYRIEQSQ